MSSNQLLWAIRAIWDTQISISLLNHMGNQQLRSMFYRATLNSQSLTRLLHKKTNTSTVAPSRVSPRPWPNEVVPIKTENLIMAATQHSTIWFLPDLPPLDGLTSRKHFFLFRPRLLSPSGELRCRKKEPNCVKNSFFFALFAFEWNVRTLRNLNFVTGRAFYQPSDGCERWIHFEWFFFVMLTRFSRAWIDCIIGNDNGRPWGLGVQCFHEKVTRSELNLSRLSFDLSELGSDTWTWWTVKWEFSILTAEWMNGFKR